MVITMARKPFMGTATDNVLSVNCGAINIESCRIMCEDLTLPKYTEGRKAGWRGGENFVGGAGYDRPTTWAPSGGGRFPSNLLLSESVVGVIDDQSGVLAKGNFPSQQTTISMYMTSKGKNLTPERDYGDIGGASRFFKVVR